MEEHVCIGVFHIQVCVELVILLNNPCIQKLDFFLVVKKKKNSPPSICALPGAPNKKSETLASLSNRIFFFSS